MAQRALYWLGREREIRKGFTELVTLSWVLKEQQVDTPEQGRKGYFGKRRLWTEGMGTRNRHNSHPLRLPETWAMSGRQVKESVTEFAYSFLSYRRQALKGRNHDLFFKMWGVCLLWNDNLLLAFVHT